MRTETTAEGEAASDEKIARLEDGILHLGGSDHIEDKPANEQNRRDRFRKTELPFA